MAAGWESCKTRIKMQEYYIDMHGDRCPDKNWKPPIHPLDPYVPENYCDRNPVEFIFYLNNDFHYIRYHMCIASRNDYDFMRDLVQKLCEKSKLYEFYKVEKSVSLSVSLRKYRMKDVELKKYVNQINFLYYNMVGKEYAITTETSFLDVLVDNDMLRDNYEKAKQFLIERGKEHHLDYLQKLYDANYLGQVSEVEVVKTIDNLIKKIKDGIKEKS